MYIKVIIIGVECRKRDDECIVLLCLHLVNSKTLPFSTRKMNISKYVCLVNTIHHVSFIFPYTLFDSFTQTDTNYVAEVRTKPNPMRKSGTNKCQRLMYTHSKCSSQQLRHQQFTICRRTLGGNERACEYRAALLGDAIERASGWLYRNFKRIFA